MATSREQQSNRKEFHLSPLGEKLKKLAKIAGVATVAATASLALITNKNTAADAPTPVSATLSNEQMMDANIAQELAKGPEGKDIVFPAFTIQPSSTAANAMIRVIRENNENYNEQATIHNKALTASAEEFGSLPDMNDGVVMWRDAELSAVHGEDVMLAIPQE